MKTAISLPDETFEQVERGAECLGVTRSEFYLRAVRHYIDHLQQHSLTNEINEALELVGDDDSATAAAAAGRRHLASTDDEW